MGRNKGTLSLSATIEAQAASPLDARFKVANFTDLTDATVWLANDGSDYTYVGMLTVVSEDVDETLRGVYRLNAQPVTDVANWKKVEGSGGTGGTDDYNELINLPKLNNITISGDKTGTDYGLEVISNKVNTISETSTEIEYPSAKAVYDNLQTKQSNLTFDDTPTTDSTNPVTSGGIKSYVDTQVGTKQDKLTAGEGIDITNNVISNTNTSAEWGDITGTLSNQTDLQAALDAKQGTLTEEQLANIADIPNKADTSDIPTLTSQLTNDSNFVVDADYVHTDNNFTDEEKLKLEGLANYDDTEVRGLINTNTESIEALTTTVEGISTSYTNLDPSVIEVGGIKTGTVFDNKTIQQIFDEMFYPELFPTLSNPSVTFTENAPTLVEVDQLFSFTLSADFNRGSISPNYPATTSGPRSGLPTGYNYVGLDVPSRVDTTEMNNDNTLTDFAIDTPRTETWTVTVDYSAGTQPLSSKGNNFNTPLSAGTTPSKSVSVTAVYPYYATTVSIDTMTKQALTTAPDGYYQADMVGETDTEKQTIEYALTSTNTLKGVRFFNTFAGTWDWLNGSQATSLNSFVGETTTRGTVEYRKYTLVGPKTGDKKYRFFIR